MKSIQGFLVNNLILILIILLFLTGLIYLIKIANKILNHLKTLSSDLKEEIRSSVQPKFLETSMEAKDLIDLAIEVWRIDQRLNKSKGLMHENTKKAIDNSMLKIKKFISNNDIEIRDYTGQKFNTGLTAIDVISVEKDKKIKEDVIKTTVEPMILLKGQIVKKAKVIILSKG